MHTQIILKARGIVTGPFRLVAVLDLTGSRVARKSVGSDVGVGNSLAVPEAAPTSSARGITVGGRRAKAFVAAMSANHRDSQGKRNEEEEASKFCKRVRKQEIVETLYAQKNLH